MNPSAPRLVAIDELNLLPQNAFIDALKPLFESAPPLAAGLFDGRPYDTYPALLDRAAAIIAGLSDAEQIAVINAHPRIGERSDSVRQQSALSYREQGYDREAALDQEMLARVYQELADLNRDYEQRFGFRFVVFVNRRPKAAILDILRERITRSPAEERATALSEMLAIARDRLATLTAAS